MNALVTLTERVLRGTMRDFDLLLAAVVPVATFVGFTLVLQDVIDTGAMPYAQYVLPAIIMQTVLFGALTAADRAARDASMGFGRRLLTLPIHTLVPLTARMTYCLIRLTVVLLTSVAIAYPFGFRLSGGVLYSLAFVLVLFVLTLALSLGADAIGTRVKRIDASSQLLLIPLLGLVLLSTGMAPATAFPDWVEPFVRAQPVSVIVGTLRGFTDGSVTTGSVIGTLGWCLGLLTVFGATAMRMQRRQ
ncbi:MAG: ABC transporter permease [Mycobacterium sp.]